jgi:hypothetical protein
MIVTSIPLPLPRSTRPISSLLKLVSIRFSLRELLLFMLTCAAFSAWGHVVYRKSQPFRPTHMAEYFADELHEDIGAIREELGVEGAAWSPGSPTQMMQFPIGMEPKEHIRRSWSGDLRLPWEKAFRFRKELEGRIVGRIRHGRPGHFTGSSEYLVGNTVGIPGFYEDEIQYRCGDIHGELRITLVRNEGQPIRLMATLNEWRVP